MSSDEFEKTSRALDELAAAVRELAAELQALAERLESRPSPDDPACHRYLASLALPRGEWLDAYLRGR